MKTYVQNDNVEVHNVVSMLKRRCTTSRRHINLKTTLKRRWNVCWDTATDNDISSSMYFMSIFLFFKIVVKMKFIRVFSVKLALCNFESIVNTVLTISICCIKPSAKISVIPLAKGWSVVSRLRYSKSNISIFKCTYAIFYLHSFTFAIFFVDHTWIRKNFSSAFLK